MNRISRGAHEYMALPAFLLFSLFFLYPFARGVGMSLTDWDGFSSPNFVGLRNFAAFFGDSRALADVAHTLLFALASTPLLNVAGLCLALLLSARFRGRDVVRAAVYLPAVISPMIMGSIWYLLLQPKRGILFEMMREFGLGMAGNWMNSGATAIAMVIVVNVWQFAGMTMVVYLAGLQAIPEEHFEAARIDGANAWQIFGRITLPGLMPALRINVITNIIGSMSVFEVILALTNGGPGYETESLSIYIMRMSYGNKAGYSTAVALVLFAIILVPVLAAVRAMDRKEDA